MTWVPSNDVISHSYSKKGIKEDLLDLINQLNFASTQYIQAIAQDPLKMKENKDKVSVILHNIFYLIKVIKAKYKVRKWCLIGVSFFQLFKNFFDHIY